MVMSKTLITVAETAEFQRRAARRLTAADLDALRNVLAADPTQGNLIAGGGGLRKLRIKVGGRGKSGGARVIYYYYDDSVPVFLLDVYAKNEQDNLRPDDLKALAGAAKSIATAVRRKRSRR